VHPGTVFDGIGRKLEAWPRVRRPLGGQTESQRNSVRQPVPSGAIFQERGQTASGLQGGMERWKWVSAVSISKKVTIVFPGHMTICFHMLYSSRAGVVSQPDMTDDSAMDDGVAGGPCHRLRMSRTFRQSGGFSTGLGRRRAVRRFGAPRSGSAGSTADKDARRHGVPAHAVFWILKTRPGKSREPAGLKPALRRFDADDQGESSQIKAPILKICPIT
jgi:hypothetical protein